MLAIDPAWGKVGLRGRKGAPFARSYDATGHEYRWYPPPAIRHARFACDVERVRGRPPVELRRRCRTAGARDFWLRWTIAEVLSKLCAVPVLILFRRYRLRHKPMKSASVVRIKGARILLRTFWIAGSGTAVTLGFSVDLRRAAARYANGARP